MTEHPARDGVDIAIQREILQVALSNSGRSVWLLMAAVLFMAWLGYDVGRTWAAGSVPAVH
jgi:hypothetical protein